MRLGHADVMHSPQWHCSSQCRSEAFAESLASLRPLAVLLDVRHWRKTYEKNVRCWSIPSRSLLALVNVAEAVTPMLANGWMLLVKHCEILEHPLVHLRWADPESNAVGQATSQAWAIFRT